MLQPKIGIDKLIINKIRIIDINIDKLSKLDSKIISLQKVIDTRHINNTNNLSEVYYLKIKDNYAFINLMAQIYRYGNSNALQTQYCKIELSVSNIKTNNLNNLSICEYKEYISYQLIKYIKEKYGIIVDVSTAHIKQIEINTSFILEKHFYEYSRVIYLLMSLLKNYLKKLNVHSNNSKNSWEEESFSRGNKSRIIKIYNKSKQLNDKNSTLSQEDKELISNNDIMRIEFSLLNNKAIKSAFDIVTLSNLTDNKLNDYFIHEFDDMFVKTYKKWLMNNRKQLLRLIKKHKANTPINWQHTFLNDCKSIEENSKIAMLLDINDLKDIIYEHYNQDRHASRIMKALIKKCDKNDSFLHDDSKKIDEIFKKVHEAYKQQ